jgi:hypothetical protein
MGYEGTHCEYKLSESNIAAVSDAPNEDGLSGGKKLGILFVILGASSAVAGLFVFYVRPKHEIVKSMSSGVTNQDQMGIQDLSDKSNGGSGFASVDIL